jgi:hypothetical protein
MLSSLFTPYILGWIAAIGMYGLTCESMFEQREKVLELPPENIGFDADQVAGLGVAPAPHTGLDAAIETR